MNNAIIVLNEHIIFPLCYHEENAAYTLVLENCIVDGHLVIPLTTDGFRFLDSTSPDKFSLPENKNLGVAIHPDGRVYTLKAKLASINQPEKQKQYCCSRTFVPRAKGSVAILGENNRVTEAFWTIGLVTQDPKAMLKGLAPIIGGDLEHYNVYKISDLIKLIPIQKTQNENRNQFK